jgi:hypothetical protein
MNQYSPQFPFNLAAWTEILEGLVQSEDTNLALEILDRMLPSYYRANKPQALKDLERKIRASKYTVHDYAANREDALKTPEHAKLSVQAILRFAILLDEIKKANEADVQPHLVDYGPGDYTLPLGLSSHSLKFTYNPIGLYDAARIDAKKLLEHVWCEHDVKDRPNWYVAYEIIEHLENEWELRQFVDRMNKLPERVCLSTPLYTYSAGNPTWRDKKIPHLRTYTPDEFISICKKMFPEYNLKYISSEVQTIIGDLG